MLTLCAIAVGLVHACAGTAFTGNAPVARAGRVYVCSVVVGVPATCALPHTGSVVLPRGSGGRHVLCHVVSGIVSRCEATGFNGDAVIHRP